MDKMTTEELVSLLLGGHDKYNCEAVSVDGYLVYLEENEEGYDDSTEPIILARETEYDEPFMELSMNDLKEAEFLTNGSINVYS